jgi:flagellar basal body-associated protein FliL
MARDLHQTADRGDTDDEAIEPPQIRRFRLLVSALMIVMMVGILGIAAALVWRVAQSTPAPASLPPGAVLETPAESTVISVSRAGSRLYLLLEDQATEARRIEERDAETGRVIGTFDLVPVPSERAP